MGFFLSISLSLSFSSLAFDIAYLLIVRCACARLCMEDIALNGIGRVSTVATKLSRAIGQCNLVKQRYITVQQPQQPDGCAHNDQYGILAHAE